MQPRSHFGGSPSGFFQASSVGQRNPEKLCATLLVVNGVGELMLDESEGKAA